MKMLQFHLFAIVCLLSFCESTRFTPDPVNILTFLDKIGPIIDVFNGGQREVCFPRLGCFSIDGAFANSLLRPVNLVPQSPTIVDTKFFLFTRASPEPQRITEHVASIRSSNFNPNLETKIIVHGYKENRYFGHYQKRMMSELKDVLLEWDNYNVILTKWNGGSSGFYFKAVSNARIVGAEIALLVNALIKHTGAPAEKFHIFGHSLGAQVAAYAGQNIKNLGRITAMDAARPHFDGMPLEVRLDQSDALYVDVVHSDAFSNIFPFGIGSANEIGDIDFFLNNGNLQPGCLSTRRNSFFNMLRESLTCDHKRSIDIVIDNYIRRDTKCIPVAYRCTSWDQFYLGRCSSCGKHKQDCAILDIHQGHFRNKRKENLTGSFYLATNNQRPYCVFQYLAKLSISNMNIGAAVFAVTFLQNQVSKISYKTRNMKMKANQEIITFLVSSVDDLRDVDTIEVTFDDQPETFEADAFIQIKHIVMTPLNHLDDSLKKQLSMRYCHQDNQATMRMDKKVSFRINNCG